MNSHKAIGEDGFPTLFYHDFWDIMAPFLDHFVSRVWNDSPLIGSANNTLFVLIPKIGQPEFLTHFRPIAFCPVIYKLDTKIMVNHLNPLLKKVISSSQSSFIP